MGDQRTIGRVYLVGAGPGNASLLTLRAVECLRRADLVLYDYLVPSRLLTYAPTAKRICVNELPGCHPERWEHVNRAMIDAAREGRCVVRLKGGDPLIFGRGGEEAAALREAGIPFEIVPGVTAALGAAAFAGIPLTHRKHASAVAFITGHECPGKAGSLLDWPALARFPGTLVFYMGLNRLPQLVEALIASGKPADTQAAVVQNASRGKQRTVTATLAEIAAAVVRAGMGPPALFVVGSVVSLREQIDWFEHLPLFGKRVLVTRPADQATELVGRLEALGAIASTLPTVHIAAPPDWRLVDDAIGLLHSFDWLVFTSVNGVHALVRRLRQIGRDLRTLGPVKLAAIGPATADALRSYYLDPDVVPSSFRSEELAAALVPHVTGKRVLLARADRGRELLREQLDEVATVEQVAVYSQVDVTEVDPELLGRLRRGEIDFVTLTSANIARSFHRLLDGEAREAVATGRVKLVTISPVTSEAVRALGWPVAAEASVYTTAGVLDAVVTLAQLTREVLRGGAI